MSEEPTAVNAGGLSVAIRGDLERGLTLEALATLTGDDVAGKLAAHDPTLWGAAARDEAERRLGWLRLPTESRDLLPRLAVLRRELENEGIEHVVLSGMGGSSLAPEVIARTVGVQLTVLDTTDPGQVGSALADRIEHTVVVVSSKSGGTLETDSHRRAFEQAFRDVRIDPARRMVAVTDPGSPLEKIAREAGYREVFLADSEVGGRYSALSAFGLVPTALAGVDVEGILDDAQALLPHLGEAENNPALLLGAVLGGAGNAGHNKIVLADFGSDVPGFGSWAEQLIAESTGKNGTGLLPVVVEGVTAPGFADTHDNLLVVLGKHLERRSITVAGSLGAQFLGWEYATAVAGRLLGINPFDQPNVQESKDNTNRILDESGGGPLPTGHPTFVEDAVEVYSPGPLLAGARGLTGVLSDLLHVIPADGYLAIMAYLDRETDADAAKLRAVLAERTGRPVTFGWGPRFLHSTGQFHKGGPQVGAFLQITGDTPHDVEIPGRPFDFRRLQMAQALGDLRALAERDRPVIRVHLRDRGLGLRSLLAAAESAR